MFVLALVASLLLAVGLLAPSASAGKKPPAKPHTPSKVVIIVVDGLSREIVHKYDMRNVKALMRDGADAPKGYLGHLGAVTVVTHNVLTTGALPKNMGWTDEGYRDVDGVLTYQRPCPLVDGNDMWLTSNFGPPRCSRSRSRRLPEARRLPARQATRVEGRRDQPEVVRRLGARRTQTDRMVTYSSKLDCDGHRGQLAWPRRHRRPDLSLEPVCGRFYIDSTTARSTTRGSRRPGSTRSTEPLHGRLTTRPARGR